MPSYLPSILPLCERATRHATVARKRVHASASCSQKSQFAFRVFFHTFPWRFCTLWPAPTGALPVRPGVLPVMIHCDESQPHRSACRSSTLSPAPTGASMSCQLGQECSSPGQRRRYLQVMECECPLSPLACGSIQLHLIMPGLLIMTPLCVQQSRAGADRLPPTFLASCSRRSALQDDLPNQ